jgi:RNA polymerase sigma-70 factor (ECF subfamily)
MTEITRDHLERDLSRQTASRVTTCVDRDLELQLVARLRQRDPAAFEAVHDAFNARLFNFLARLANSRDVAEDLLEETWLRLVSHASRLQPDTRLGPWLFTVARNLHVSYRRSRAIDDSGDPEATCLWFRGTPAPSPLEVAEASEMERRLAGAIAALPTIYREALLLVGIEGLSPAEAAAVCEVSSQAMRQRLSRARALVDRHLSATDGPGLTALREVIT